jgi:PRTRC genetic system ParB family protein
MSEATQTQSQDVNVVFLDPNALVDFSGGNSRQSRNLSADDELVVSIRNIGVQQPIIVRPSPNNPEQLEVVAGHRRRDACAIAGVKVKAEIQAHLTNDERTALEIHLSENLHRQDLSISDEVKLAQRWVSHYQGDRNSAAKRLGWSTKKLSERLELIHATDDVLGALDRAEIGAGHALLLSALPERLQNNSLKTVISEKLTVAALKARVAKVQLPLDTAKFDKTDCQTCAHNSSRQSGLFDLGDAGATCSNGSCYKTKTHEFLAGQRDELEAKFGKVLFMSESHPSDRATVDAANVGQEQFDSECLGCQNRIAVLDDRPTREGGVLESQCVDLSCFRKCVSALKTPQVQEPEKPVGASENKSTTSEAKLVNKATNPEKAVKQSKTNSQSVPSGVVDMHKREIVTIGREYLKDNDIFRLSLAVISVRQLSGQASRQSIPDMITKLMALDKQALFAELSKELTTMIEKTSTFSHYDAFSVFTAALRATDGGVDATIEAWKPSESSLNTYFTEALKQLCKDAGIDKALADEYTTAAKQKKGDFVKSILGFKFDWTKFAPKTFVNLLKTGSK